MPHAGVGAPQTVLPAYPVVGMRGTTGLQMVGGIVSTEGNPELAYLLG